MQLYIKDGQIKAKNRIIIRNSKHVTINPTHEQIIADGWQVYEAPEVTTPQPSRRELVEKLIISQFNTRTDISNEEALEFALLVYSWDHYLGKPLTIGTIVLHNEKLYRVRQDINIVIEGQEPSESTAALYEVIDKEHEGTQEDPIPYTPPMEIFEGKYYIQEGIIYLCTRASEVALTHNLADLVGIYVTVA